MKLPPGKRVLNVVVPEELHEAVRHFAFEGRISIGEATRRALSRLVGWSTRNGEHHLSSRSQNTTAKKR